jgi:hypothetical protein
MQKALEEGITHEISLLFPKIELNIKVWLVRAKRGCFHTFIKESERGCASGVLITAMLNLKLASLPFSKLLVLRTDILIHFGGIVDVLVRSSGSRANSFIVVQYVRCLASFLGVGRGRFCFLPKLLTLLLKEPTNNDASSVFSRICKLRASFARTNFNCRPCYQFLYLRIPACGEGTEIQVFASLLEGNDLDSRLMNCSKEMFRFGRFESTCGEKPTI